MSRRIAVLVGVRAFFLGVCGGELAPAAWFAFSGDGHAAAGLTLVAAISWVVQATAAFLLDDLRRDA